MSKRKNSSKTLPLQTSSENSSPSALRFGVMAGVALIVVITCIAYIPSINGGFILDDDKLITDNRLIRASDGLYKFWCTAESVDYWPVTNTSFWIEWRLWGMNPIGYHAVNLVLHIVEALLIWLILQQLSIPGAFLAALIFAVHPVNVESVAWISQRKNTMAMFFFLLSILCYLQFLTRTRAGLAAKQPAIYSSFIIHHSSFYWLSLVAFVLAMLSKGSAAVLPVILLGIIWWMRTSGTVPVFAKRKWGLSPYFSTSDLIQTVPFFLVSIVLTLVSVWFQKHGMEVVIRNAGFTERLLGAGGVVWFYLYKAILPFDLAFVYPQWQIEAGNILWWLPLLAAAAVTAVLWLYRNTWSRQLLFAWGFFCVALVPALGFIDVGYMKFSLVADHYQHIAIIGVITLVSAGFSDWRLQSHEATRRAPTVVAVAVVGCLALLTWKQSAIYSDPVTLYKATLAKNPDCCMAHNNLGFIFARTGQYADAEKHYEKALLLSPDYPDAHNNLGIILSQSGRFQQAIDHYEHALRFNPEYAEAENNLGNTLLTLGRSKDAEKHYEEALKLNPNYPDAHNNIGVVMAQSGKTETAIEHYKEALRLKPDYFDACNNLGIALVQTARYEEAIEYFQHALRLKPDFINAYSNLAGIYAGLNRSSEAIAVAQKALELAQRQGQPEQIKQIEDWLKSYQGQETNSQRQ